MFEAFSGCVFGVVSSLWFIRPAHAHLVPVVVDQCKSGQAQHSVTDLRVQASSTGRQLHSRSSLHYSHLALDGGKDYAIDGSGTASDRSVQYLCTLACPTPSSHLTQHCCCVPDVSCPGLQSTFAAVLRQRQGAHPTPGATEPMQVSAFDCKDAFHCTAIH